MKVLIRADAGPGVGSGHLMRCLALAQGFQDRGIDPTFAMAQPVQSFRTLLEQEDLPWIEIPHPPGSVRDAEVTRELASTMRADWIVVDGYQFDALYQYLVMESDARLLFVDDNGHAGAYVADLVLNQNLHARSELYPDVASDSTLLLGTEFILLRREFVESVREQQTRKRARRVLVSIGGSDPGPTVETIQALAQQPLSSLEIVVVVGPSNPGVEVIKAAASGSGLPVRVEAATRAMPELMSWADVAVASAGAISWELAFMGLPFLAVVMAENQREVAASLDRANVAVDLGWWSETMPGHLTRVLGEILGDFEKRRRMSARGLSLVDGKGVARVIGHIQAGTTPRRDAEGATEEGVQPAVRGLRMREVEEEDRLLLWQWANDRSVRASSFRSDPIPWETHVHWFEAMRANDSCLMYMIEDDEGRPLGQSRFTRSGRSAEIHVSLATEVRGRGLGKRVLQMACDRYQRDVGPGPIVAYIKPDNTVSIRAFMASGFDRVGVTQRQGNPAVKLALSGAGSAR